MVLPAITRRAFMKGIGALAGSKVLPKGITKALSGVSTEGVKYAPPWINAMLKTLKGTPTHGSNFNFAKLANGAQVAKIGSQAKKIYGGEAKETFFRVKTTAGKVGDNPKLGVEGQQWDDIILTEEPGQTSLTWKNKNYDHGNDQHIVIDHKNKETRFVDDNWSMDAGGEDIVKDDWIEFPIETNKTALERKEGLFKGDADDYMVDYQSVNDMDEWYQDMFHEYVDSFSPSGNMFGTAERAQLKLQKEQLRKLEKLENDRLVRERKEDQMAKWEDEFRGGFGMHGYNKGGFVDYGEMKEVVPPLDGYAAGGIGKLVVKQAPKVLNKLREWAPQITGTVAKPQKLKNPWAVFDKHGNPIQEFKLKKEADAWWKKAREESPETEYYEEVIQYNVGKIDPTKVKPTKPKETDAPAMFFRSREEIIQGPPIMTGEQWMQFLKARGVRDIEMMDTSLGPWLSANLKNKVSKNDLVAKFDNIVPDFDVQVTGRDFSEGMSIAKGLQNVDSTVFSPESSKIIRFLQAQTKNISDDKSAKEVMTSLDNLFENAYGIKNVTKEGIPADSTSVPYEIKQVMTDVLSAGRQRGVGMEGSAFVGSPSHGSSQVFGGSTSGKNYREFLFNWKPKGPRINEPKYDYAHSFGGAKGENAFMHARVSDRVDEYGNKLIFVEEFQSDMHQPISAALRKAEKEGKKIPKEGKYFPRLDVATAKSNKSNLEQMANIQRQIERLLETNPRSPKLKKLYEQKEMIRGIESEAAQSAGKGTSNIPEGPFKNSQDYMEFAIKYLLRVAKDGNYDGVAFSTPAIKNLKMTPGSKDYQGNIIAYGNILKNAIQKAKSKSGADLVETSIGAKVDRQTGRYGSEDVMQYFGVPALMLKGNTKALEKISKGLPAYKDGGLTETIPPEKGPLPYGIFKDVVPTL